MTSNRRSSCRPLLPAVLVLGLSSLVAAQNQSVLDGPHNLSASSTGDVRAVTEDQVCIFCHTSHSAAPVTPLWNRYEPVAAYNVYSSNALNARPGQPTGISKMCLSCHDGTIAVGSVVSRDQTIQMAGGITTLPPGASNLGTDLSDDHPISFRYDSTLTSRDPMIVPAHELPDVFGLDELNKLQCTTCHDAHDNSYGDFLVMSNQNSAMCIACHRLSSTTVAAHNDCVACHRTHSAPSGPYLLRADRITATCVSCHNGSNEQAMDILGEIQKMSSHDTNSPVDPPEPVSGHATCADCHEPHTMASGSAQPPSIQPTLGQVSGVNASGTSVPAASYEYEVCFKCHADENVATSSYISRQLTQVNTRLEFDPASISYHPVQVPGRNSNVPSLRQPWTTSSVMHCSDCHGSDSSRAAGGTGPDGVHGSSYAPVLLARYDTADFTNESESAYALCYRCHYRTGANGILSDRSFPHERHVARTNAPCSVCHDAHGISSVQGSGMENSHLINFDTSIVLPHPQTGEMKFVDTGLFSGTCTLMCHGKRHRNAHYTGR